MSNTYKVTFLPGGPAPLSVEADSIEYGENQPLIVFYQEIDGEDDHIAAIVSQHNIAHICCVKEVQ